MLVKASMKKKALFRWYRAVHVRVREELRKTSSCSTNESVENTACIPRAASATSRTWRFYSQAGILQVTQWQSPVASLHPVLFKTNSLFKFLRISFILSIYA
jgi:hypothetical protein